MDKAPNGWNLVKKIGKITELGSGADSEVSRVSNHEKNVDLVIKEYGRLESGPNHPQNAEEILKEYYSDTEKARKLTEKNPNPLNQSIRIGNEEIFLNYEIESQGLLMLENESVNETPKKMSLGQRFIGGFNFSLLMERESAESKLVPDSQQVFINNPRLCRELHKMVLEFFVHLQKTLSVHFIYNPMNVKPFFDEKEKRVRIVITDLASNLRSYYEHKLEKN